MAFISVAFPTLFPMVGEIWHFVNWYKKLNNNCHIAWSVLMRVYVTKCQFKLLGITTVYQRLVKGF
jgi:hypothetical protein